MFVTRNGWECPAWFRSATAATMKDAVAAECRAATEGCGLADRTARARLLVSGADAADLLASLFGPDIPRTAGGVLDHLTTLRGSDAPTRIHVTCLGSSRFVVVAAPAWLFALRPGPGWSDLPGYWRQAAGWLEKQDRQARTLLVPGTGFGLYSWGRTVDEPIQRLLVRRRG